MAEPPAARPALKRRRLGATARETGDADLPVVAAQHIVHVEENDPDYRVAAPASSSPRSRQLAAMRGAKQPQCSSREGSGGGNVNHPRAFYSAHIHRRSLNVGALEPER
jgi:hypothetical protein